MYKIYTHIILATGGQQQKASNMYSVLIASEFKGTKYTVLLIMFKFKFVYVLLRAKIF